MSTIKKAMILAAGYGTRLKPLTDSLPKALIKVNGTPMIETVLKRLIEYGINDVVINVHHMAEEMRNYFKENNYGINIRLIYEKEILGTGGGIRNAESFLRDEESFIVHNVDVNSDIDFNELAGNHNKQSALATLAVKYRPTSRPLIIDEKLNVIGRKSTDKNYRYRNPEGKESYPGFCGIHVISNKIFDFFERTVYFDIFTAYFGLITAGEKIVAFDIGNCLWDDFGKYDMSVHSL
jgi:NDP-sugar pyrophosphorylase family protein